MAALSTFATDGLQPDLVLVLDVDDATAESRRAPGADRMEREGTAFHAEVRAAYRELAARRGWVVIDGSGAPAAVAEVLLAAIEPLVDP